MKKLLTTWQAQGEAPLHLPTAGLLLESLISLAGYGIGLALLFFLYKRRGWGAPWLLAVLALFIVVYSTLHLLNTWGLWVPGATLQAYLKLFSVLALLTAAVGLWGAVLRPRRMRGQTLAQLRGIIRQLEHEIAERKRAETALQQSREQLRQLAAYQEQVKEDERKRIAREVHDDLGQNLMVLRIDVSLLHERTAASHPRLHAKAGQTLEHIDATIRAVRVIINNLRPAVLDLGLQAAIEWQLREFERRTGIHCFLQNQVVPSDFEMDDHRATAFFRILQESLTNVARHAQATEVRIVVQRQDQRFCMAIEDNGIGMFAGCRRKSNSFGLLGIEERVSSLGGEFRIEADSGRGSRLSVCIPIAADADADAHADADAGWVRQELPERVELNESTDDSSLRR